MVANALMSGCDLNSESAVHAQQSSVNEVVLVAAKSETKEKVKAIYRHLHPGVDNPG